MRDEIRHDADEAPAQVRHLAAQLDRYPIDHLLSTWRAQPETSRRARLVGATGTFLACALADLTRRLDRAALIITPSTAEAERLAQALELFVTMADDDADDAEAEAEAPARTWREGVVVFPEYDVGPFHQATQDRQTTMRRLTTLYELTTQRAPRFVVASAPAIMRLTLPPEVMRQHARAFEFGDELSDATLRDLLRRCGYTEVPLVEDPGTFAIRGDIVDLYSPLDAHPVRIERWGDEISDLRQFHAQTQRTLRELERVHIFPVRQEILDPALIPAVHDRLHALGAAHNAPTSQINTLLTDLRAGLHFLGIDALLPALHDRLADLTDYLQDDMLTIFTEPDRATLAMRQVWEKRTHEHAQAVASGELFFDVGSYYRAPEALAAWAAARHERVEASQLAMEGDPEGSLMLPHDASQTFELRARGNEDLIHLRKTSTSVEQTVQALAERLDTWRDLYGRVCFACRTATQADRLVELLQTFAPDRDVFTVPPPIDASVTLPPPAEVVEVYVADIPDGFRSEMLSLCLISGREVFGHRVASRDASQAFSDQAAITHFRDLTAGDLIVHLDFGIGRYLGLVHLEVEGVGNDFLQLEYLGGDKLYLPVYRLGRVQKFIGGSESARLDKLGGSGWEKTKERVKANIREVAGELLELYARRELARGYAFGPPDATFAEFEERFPYQETPDQARAIHETLVDMQRNRPMDRLVCGDVGFGKTEVAIRAAMKAVLDGKQVAVLVPTTILAEQHAISFNSRMQEAGVIVECLSRFRSAKESKEIIARAAEGQVDVVIGTHRLLNKQVQFRDLGLLIVDEEQRFGVAHKDKIKRLRANVDVLTLSATPIPRTLQMSLLGIRDLSIIATPPHTRLAVRTHVAKFSDRVIREAIMRELQRGGQVFFVHNRVSTIEEMADRLRDLVPEARIGIGHGQMPEQELEDVMLSYVRGDLNVLLCSSIIESGLDIPNANTIIVNRADMFGLSQLYQLRGRVGRGTERAYAYLLIPARRTLPKDAERRLEVIQTYTELGSGFHVASYDLEIRGAGSMLGVDQSGHVATVGIDLYNELLEEAIHDLRGEELEEEIDPEVNIPITSFIPDDYIPAMGLRLMFYKRFSLARDEEELFDVFNEMVDRFGKAPEPVRSLREIVSLKLALRRLRARRLDAGPSAISLEIDATTPLDPGEVLRLVRESRGKLRITEQMRLIYNLNPEESARPVATSRMLLDTLLATLGAS